MKQQAKKKEQELTAIKGGKDIPFKRTISKDKEGNDVEVTTGKLILFILTYNPSVADPENYGNWGITTAEMRERRAIRKAVENVHKDSTILTLTPEQAKVIYDMCSIIKWKGEDDFILDFQESLK